MNKSWSVLIYLNIFRTLLYENIYAHEETGNQWTFDRDIDVQNGVKNNNILLSESPTNGVVRGLKNRSEWSKIRKTRIYDTVNRKACKLDTT